MKKLIASVSISLAALTYLPAPAQAVSEAACSIWLCLPAGFPEGCSAAHSEFRHRLKKGKSPLPPFSSCAVGGSTGTYEMGYQLFDECKEGYVEKEDYIGNNQHIQNACVSVACTGGGALNRANPQTCDVYARTQNPKPNFVKMWVDGDFVGKYHF